MTAQERVVVVGAGVSGLAVARDLAPDHEVVVLDRGGVAADTTSRASGVISLSLEPFPDEWSGFALDAFRALDDQGIFSFTERETVRLVPEDDGEFYADAAPAGGEFFARDDLDDRFESVFGDLTGHAGGMVYDGTGFIDVLEYAMTLKWAAERAGAAVYRDHAVTGLGVEDGAVVGVDTEHGSMAADYVVVATGWRVRDQLSAHVELPVRPLRWNALVLDSTNPHTVEAPMGSEPTRRVYWRPTRRGNVLVGGNEHLLADPDTAPSEVHDSFRDLVLDDVAPLLDGVSKTILREDCCPTADSASPDGLPIVDAPADAPDGLVVATGFHGRGVMFSPVTGRVVRSLVTDDPAPFPTDALSLSRFDDRSADFEYLSHWA